MSDQGNEKRYFVGTGIAEGKDRARNAVTAAFSAVDTEQCRASKDVILDVYGEITIQDAADIGKYVERMVGGEKHLVFNATGDDDLGDKIKVTVFLRM